MVALNRLIYIFAGNPDKENSYIVLLTTWKIKVDVQILYWIMPFLCIEYGKLFYGDQMF